MKRQINTTANPLIFGLRDENDIPVDDAVPGVHLRKPGGSFVSATGTVVEIGGGLYEYEWAGGDLDTLGDLLVRIEAVGARTVEGIVKVVSYDPYNTIHRARDHEGQPIATAADQIKLRETYRWDNGQDVTQDVTISPIEEA